jgi:site-specific recombinase XerD
MLSVSGAGGGLRCAAAETTAMERLRDRMARELRVRGKAERTVRSYVDDVRLLVERTGLHPARLSEEQLKGYLDELVTVRKVVPSTYAQHVAAMRFFFTYVVKRDFTVLKDARPRRRRVLPDILTVAEVEALLHALRIPQLFTLCAALYSCGLRRSEGLALAVEDLDRGRALLHVRDGKGGVDRFVPMPPRLQEILDAHLQREAIASGPLFLSRLIPGRAICDDNVGKALHAAAAEAGIRKPVTPHGLRHCYATHLLERGVSLLLIQQFLGHRSIETTTIYTHVTDSSMARVHEALGLMTARL